MVQAIVSSICPIPMAKPNRTNARVSQRTLSYTNGQVYLENYGLLVAGDVDTVGLSVRHVPVVYINIIRFSGAAQVVPDL